MFSISNENNILVPESPNTQKFVEFIVGTNRSGSTKYIVYGHCIATAKLDLLVLEKPCFSVAFLKLEASDSHSQNALGYPSLELFEMQ